jgi:hypothetical protein
MSLWRESTSRSDSPTFGVHADFAPALPADRPDHHPTLVGRQERRTDFTALNAVRVVLLGDVGL